MVDIRLEHVSKVYEGKKKNQNVLAVNDFNLEITKKEFVVFVGPSAPLRSIFNINIQPRGLFFELFVLPLLAQL